MSIRKRPSKKNIGGFTYQVYFPYINASGEHCIYCKGGFTNRKSNRKSAKDFEIKKRNEILNYGCLYLESSVTLDDVFKDAYAIAKRTYAKATQVYYQETYKIHIAEYLGKRKLSTIAYRDLQERVNVEGNSYSIARNIKKVLIMIYKYAFKQGLIKENLAKLVTVDIVNPEDKEAKNITADKIDLVCDEIEKTKQDGS